MHSLSKILGYHDSHYSIFISLTMKLILVEFCTEKLLGEFSVCAHMTLSRMFYSVMLLVNEIIQHW